MIDYKALKGDPTDNIPGVPGVGEKTAAKLIREFGTLEALYERIDEVKPDKLRDKLIENREAVFMGKDLTTIVRDLPVDFDLEAARLGDYDRETVIRLFREYEFRTLIERLPAMTGETAGDAAEALRGVATDGSVPAARVAGARAVGLGLGATGRGRRPRAAAAAVARLRCRRARRRADAAGTSARTDPPPWIRGRDERGRRAPSDRPARPAPKPGARTTCRRPSPRRSPTRRGSRSTRATGSRRSSRGSPPSRRSGSGSCSTTRVRAVASPLALAVAGTDGRTVAVEGPDDAATLRRLLDRLDGPARRPRGQAAAGRADRRRSRRRPDAGRLRHPDRRVHPQRLAAQPDDRRRRRRAARPDPAAGRRARLPRPAPVSRRSSALAVREPLERRLVDDGLDRLYREIELPLIPVLARMEATGVALDLRGPRRSWRTEFAAEIARLETEIYADVGHEFNLGSPKQLEQILFFELNLPKGKRTKTGYSTDASVLEDLRPAHPMIDKLLDWRIYTKLRSTYVDALPTLIAADGRLHTTFHQAVAATGRLSSSDPNLQNIPIRTAARSADPARVRGRWRRPDAGGRGLQPDRAADPRPRLGRRAPPRRVRAERRHPPRDRRAGAPQGPGRRHARRAVDGQDGQLRARLRDERLRAVERASIPRAEAQEFINTYFATYSGISYYMLAIKEQARTQGT